MNRAIESALLALASDPTDRGRAALHARQVLAAKADPAELRRVALPPERLDALLDRGCPLAFAAPPLFDRFVDELIEALGEALDGEAGQLRVIGTSATLFTLHPHKSPLHFFDAREGDRSDVDLGIESPALFAWLAGQGAAVEPSPINALGTVSSRELRRISHPVAAWIDRWSTKLQRRVEAVVPGGGLPRSHPSAMDITRPLGPRLVRPGPVDYGAGP